MGPQTFSLKKGKKGKLKAPRIALSETESREDDTAEPVIEAAQFVEDVSPSPEVCIIIPPTSNVISDAKEPLTLEDELKRLPPPPEEEDFESLSVEEFGSALLRGLEKRGINPASNGTTLNTVPLPKPRHQFSGVGVDESKSTPVMHQPKKRKINLS